MRAGRCSPMPRWCSKIWCGSRKPKEVVISALGVREGLLYSMLDAKEREKDPLIAAASELNVLRSRSPAHGEELIALDRPLHGIVRARRDRGGAPAAPCRLPARRHRLAGASRLSRRAVAQHHRQCGLRRGRSSRPHLHRAGRVLPPCRAGGRGAFAAAARARHRPACSTARACSARRCASPISSPPRPPACCRRRRWWSSAAGWCCGSRTASRRSPASACSSRLRQLARLIGREPVMETA